MVMEIKQLYISVSDDFEKKKSFSWNSSYLSIDRDNMYNGRVFGETKSSVRAHIDDGVFTGSIVLPDETYHIEVSNLECSSFGVFLLFFDMFTAIMETPTTFNWQTYDRLQIIGC